MFFVETIEAAGPGNRSCMAGGVRNDYVTGGLDPARSQHGGVVRQFGGQRMRAAVGTSLLVITLSSPAAPAMPARTADGLDWSVIGRWPERRSWAPGRQTPVGEAVRAPPLRVFALVLLALAGFMPVDAMMT